MRHDAARADALAIVASAMRGLAEIACQKALDPLDRPRSSKKYL